MQIAPVVSGPLGGGQTISRQFQTAVPSMVAQTPLAGASDVAISASQIRVEFDDAVDAGAVSLANIELLAEGEPVSISEPLYDATDLSVSFAPAAGILRAGSSYSVRLSAALGGALRAEDYSWAFTTAIPGLSSIDPADKDTGVSTASLAQVEVGFTAPIDAVQAIADNFVLLRNGQSVSLRANDPVDLGANKYLSLIHI